MEFTKLRGFWKTKTSKPSDVIVDLEGAAQLDCANKSNAKTTSTNNNENVFTISQKTKENTLSCKQISGDTLDTLEEIRLETTSEGFGLRTPYGTHIDLDFMKYCEEINSNSKPKLQRTLSLRQPKNQHTSLMSPRAQPTYRRLASHPSNESITSHTSEGNVASTCNWLISRADQSLFETRRRLEAFLSFRTRPNHTASDELMSPRENIETNNSNIKYNRHGSNSSLSSIGNTEKKLNSNPQVSSHQLSAIRNQMASALLRIRELEEQVKQMTPLEEQVSQLNREKKQMETKMKEMREKQLSFIEAKVFASPSPKISLCNVGSAISPRGTHQSLENDSVFEQNTSKKAKHKDSRFHNMLPPPVPKRRYCSVGVGDNNTIESIVCYSREKATKNVSSSCNLPIPSSHSFEFSHKKNGNFPALPPSPENSQTPLFNDTYYAHSSSQTCLSLSTSATQTKRPKHREKGCGDGRTKQFHDQASDPIISSSANASTMACPEEVKTHDRQTSSRDLIQLRHVQVGCDFIKRTDASTNTSQIVNLTKQTSSDDLFQMLDVKIGMDFKRDQCDKVVSTNPIVTSDFGVNCSLPTQSTKQFLDKTTMTLLETETIRSTFNNSVSLGVGVNESKNYFKDNSHLENQAGQQSVTKSSTRNISSDVESISNLPTKDVATNTIYLDIRKDATKADELTPLKSIMKKPGTPTSPKKFLRFAEDVESDESEFAESSEEEEDSFSEKEFLLEEVSENDEEEVETKDSNTDIEVITNKEKTLKSEVTFIPSASSSKMAKKYREFIEIPINSSTAKKEGFFSIESNKYLKADPGFENENQFFSYRTTNDTNNKSLKTKTFSTNLLEAVYVLDKHLNDSESTVSDKELNSVTSIIQEEWFRVAAKADSTRKNLEEFLADLETTAFSVFQKVVNLLDTNGNTVLHYAISHGNTEIIERLLQIDELDLNRPNISGFTPAMLAAICEIESEEDYKVLKHLFSKSDVNLHAQDAGQTALMLAVSHGNVKTVELLLMCGAEINATDFDGSTALMCAAEHGKLELLRILLATPGCDKNKVDSGGYTALEIAMDVGHKEISMLLYTSSQLKSSHTIAETSVDNAT